MTPVVRTYLEMRSPGLLVARRLTGDHLATHLVRECHPELWRSLYRGVGRDYRWTDRLEWSDADIRRYLDDPAISLHVFTEHGEVAGYYELRREADGSIEIAYFGLLPGRLGRGLGAHLLTDAVETAWAQGAVRVWLHTCTLDHPAALPNYLSAGFSIFKSEELPPL